ncbi:DUF2057 family protein [Acinetobacter sp. ANC 4178]|uniref:DUF2057 family protein n=1 Tax=Acinetobacter sp. ANC 4178 TaxID=2529839 RepID=UPI0010395891|nr:DUF2057 family protein [Acinetobacter sp. ANC 4178]TCB68369.1 DUF2057 domain-containing protein [Acinetobacter sp. ANC 4178]
MALRLTFATAALMVSSSVFSAVTITAPETIKILAVNDQEVNTGLFRSENNTYKLDAGSSDISVRYIQYFEHMSGEHDIVKSGVVTLKTPSLQDNQTYKLALINPPKTFEDAKKYAQQPTIALFDQKQQVLVQQTGANTEQKPWLSRSMFGGALDLTQKKSTPVNQPPAVYTQPVANSPSSTLQVATNAKSNAIPVDQELIELWKKANKAERQKFMGWVAEQAN